MNFGIDLGYDHSMQWYVAYGNPDALIGIIVWHPLTEQCGQSCIDHGVCGGSVPFDVIENRQEDRNRWQVVSMEPLTLSPSLLCHCGDHGFIQGGRWVVVP